MPDHNILDEVEKAFADDPTLMPHLPREQLNKAIYELRFPFIMNEFSNRDMILVRVLIAAARIDTTKYETKPTPAR